MKVLGIDTSTMSGSIGLIQDEEVISEYLLNVSVTHSERLLDAIGFVLRNARCAVEDLDGLAVSLGPGSFTGVRIIPPRRAEPAAARNAPLYSTTSTKAKTNPNAHNAAKASILPTFPRFSAFEPVLDKLIVMDDLSG